MECRAAHAQIEQALLGLGGEDRDERLLVRHADAQGEGIAQEGDDLALAVAVRSHPSAELVDGHRMAVLVMAHREEGAGHELAKGPALDHDRPGLVRACDELPGAQLAHPLIEPRRREEPQTDLEQDDRKNRATEHRRRGEEGTAPQAHLRAARRGTRWRGQGAAPCPGILRPRARKTFASQP